MVRRILAGALAVAVAAGAALVGTGTPALAATAEGCASAPSDQNCSGARIDASYTSSDPCFTSSYPLSSLGSAFSGATFDYTDLGWTFRTQLRYSTRCKSNFTLTIVEGVGPLPYHVSNKVRRGGVSGGLGYRMEHADWYYPILYQWIGSPLVYSPNNPAASCLSTNSSDQFPCTTGGPANDGYY